LRRGGRKDGYGLALSTRIAELLPAALWTSHRIFASENEAKSSTRKRTI